MFHNRIQVSLLQGADEDMESIIEDIKEVQAKPIERGVDTQQIENG